MAAAATRDRIARLSNNTSTSTWRRSLSTNSVDPRTGGVARYLPPGRRAASSNPLAGSTASGNGAETLAPAWRGSSKWGSVAGDRGPDVGEDDRILEGITGAAGSTEIDEQPFLRSGRSRATTVATDTDVSLTTCSRRGPDPSTEVDAGAGVVLGDVEADLFLFRGDWR